MQHYKGQFTQVEWQDPDPCLELPPANPNTFPDGSVTTPLHPDLGLGGAGIWWPNRSLQDAPLHMNEVNNAVHVVKDGGVRAVCQLDSY